MILTELSHKSQIRTVPSQRPGERSATFHGYHAAVLGLILLLVVPAHVASSPSYEHGSEPSVAGNHARPEVASEKELRDATPPEILRGGPPRASYPSDAYSTTSPGLGILLRSAIDHHNFPAAWAAGYQGQGVNVAVVDQGIDFGHPDLNGSFAVEGNATSPYAGWPLAFDPKSMGAYLKTGFTDGTSYANTSLTGPGPFEITHTIKVDGTNDFGESERIGADPLDNSGGSPGGNKQDYDLTDLYATRDANRWYFGFSGYLRQANDSYVLLLDVDNETGGTTTVPAGKLADTNTSATDIVTDIAFSPTGLQIATVSADRFLRVWDRAGRVIFAAMRPFVVSVRPGSSTSSLAVVP